MGCILVPDGIVPAGRRYHQVSSKVRRFKSVLLDYVDNPKLSQESLKPLRPLRMPVVALEVDMGS